MKNAWKQVVGFEGLYEISDTGTVRSLSRRVPTKGNGTRIVRGRILNPAPDRNGYIRVQLFKNGVCVRAMAHRLVLEAFVGPCPEGCEACHGNGIPADNRIENLRWGTAKDNASDRYAHHGSYVGKNHMAHRDPERYRRVFQSKAAAHAPRGEKHGCCKLSAVKVHKIRSSYRPRHPQFGGAALARAYGVSKSCVRAIVTRKIWAHVA